MTEESICQVCEADGFCQIQDDKDDSKYNCLINSTWASNQSRLKAVRNWIEKQHQYGEGGLEELDKILEAD